MNPAMQQHVSVAASGPVVWVCTFATAAYDASAAVLRQSALDVGGVDRVVVYGEDDVAEFCEVNGIDTATRGHGWFAWKPWCIAHAMTHHASPGDVIVWCDAAMTFRGSVRALVTSGVRCATDIVLFRLGEWQLKDHSIGTWTKPGTLRAMGIADDDDRVRTAPQVNAAIQVYRHSPAASSFVRAWLEYCRQPDVVSHDADGEPPHDHGEPPHPHPHPHRWDQSILSVLALDPEHARHITLCRDPTQYGANDPPLAGDQSAPHVPLVAHHRLMARVPKVAVITPTIGSPHLAECVASVQAQQYPHLVHWIVVDGPRYESRVRAAVDRYRHGAVPMRVMVLPRNTGAGGYNGHMCYGALPWLVGADTEYVAFLDDDNAVDPDHYKLLVYAATGAGVAWAHSLRRIVDREGRHVCFDNCESLGGLCVTTGGRRLVDTSCYVLRRDLAIEFGSLWHARFRDPSGREPDRDVAEHLLAHNVPHVVVRRHSVAYRVGNTPASVGADYFLAGNACMGYDFAAHRELYVFHFSPDATSCMLACRRRADRSYALDEWQMTLWKGLDAACAAPEPAALENERFNILHGYACLGGRVSYIPPGACVAVAICQPEHVPWDFLAARTDLWRIAYTLESPNIRHAHQWDPVRLAACFDVVLTYWDDLLRDPRVNTLYCPHNTHHLDLDAPLDRAVLRFPTDPTDPADPADPTDPTEPAERPSAVCMVLEHRPGLEGTYRVPNMDDVELTCLDPLRLALVRDLRDATVYGVGWADAGLPATVRVGHTLHRSKDPRSAVDIMSRHTFALIVENCDAAGYVSEKLYDALIAGVVPLYYGNAQSAPHVPTDTYVDLKAVLAGVAPADMSRELQRYLDSLTAADVAVMRRRVLDGREDVLRAVGVDAFAARVRDAIRQRPA